METKKSSFTILESIFVVIIISIIASIALSKLQTPVNKASIIKLKSDVYSIRAAIVNYKSQMIQQNSQNLFPTKLDSAQIDIEGESLFIGDNQNRLLNYPIISTNSTKKDSLKWSKKSENIYIFYINNTTSIEFNYNNSLATFDCDYSDKICQEVNQ